MCHEQSVETEGILPFETWPPYQHSSAANCGLAIAGERTDHDYSTIIERNSLLKNLPAPLLVSKADAISKVKPGHETWQKLWNHAVTDIACTIN